MPAFYGQVRVLVEDDDESKPRRFAYLAPTLVVLVILVVLGLILAFAGPLPTIFPQCGGCALVHN